MRRFSSVPAVGAVLLTATALTACGKTSAPAAYSPKDDTSTYDSARQLSDWSSGDADDFSAVIDLPDGRKVSMFYAKDRGLAEQHYSPEADAWTAPKIVYKTATDPCQGIALAQHDGTVAVTADWNLYCYDGEPPDESIAGVATGDLTEWTTDLTRHFDGWSAPVVSDDGTRATWKHHADRLVWSSDGGFDKDLG
ncbi:hypothetical protein [Aeromicrobium endophyticum]|uniref:Uncharacterized protein n=1 Tax=Aeromicrobium endophyticum TaxID=2292704 RepID=A0A371P125_9ACTN|nr:hypothetical protein [Aeromicrobium endophyticum]REK69654.1 hypothetical protein DX116_10635 [Aeromicrobium endophyticum]